MIEEQFRGLAMAALKIGGTLLEELPAEQQHALENALHAGCKLELTFGPLPTFDALALVLVEPEGARRTVVTLAPNMPIIQ